MVAEPPSDGLLEAFERDGYLIIDPGIPEDLLDRAVSQLRGYFVSEPPREGLARKLAVRMGLRQRIVASYLSPIRVQDAWQGLASVRAIAMAPRVLALLRRLYGREPRPFQTLNFRVGTQQSPHSDTIHFNSQPPGYMCGVWVALEDVHADSGPLEYFPGSHRLPEVTPRDVGAPPGPEGYGAYERHVRGLIEERGLERRVALLHKGEALVWASNLLHGGAPRDDPYRTRLSQVTHYFFEGCRYWTPLLSDERHVEWREPYWVL